MKEVETGTQNTAETVNGRRYSVAALAFALGAWMAPLYWLVGGESARTGAVTAGLIAGVFLGPSLLACLATALRPDREWRLLGPAIALDVGALIVPGLLVPNPYVTVGAAVSAAATAALVTVLAAAVTVLRRLIGGD